KVPIMNATVPTRIFTADSTASSEGKGSVDRKEALQTNVAAVVTQVLPNGNLVVEGKQEVRVNFEIRELIVAGIVRPEDIQSDNGDKQRPPEAPLRRPQCFPCARMEQSDIRGIHHQADPSLRSTRATTLRCC